MTVSQTLRVGNCSGFYGDRLSAMREMLEGGDLDVLTGDYLAELTMLILGRDRMRDARLGYARTFVRQLQDCLGLAIDKGVQIVANAGGLNPIGCRDAIAQIAAGTGLDVSIAVVDGDDLTSRTAELGLGEVLAANAYLGAFGIAEACRAGADVVITGRVTDASLVVGPAIARFDWGRTDYDALAGAMAAGHVIECGTQVTGGNFAFFTEIADLTRPGFPIAEIHSDGSSVITKHEGTGGAVTVETVLSQLLYEVQDARYAGPDAVLRLDSLKLNQDGPDRVRINGARGEAPPPQVKVSSTALGGFRNELNFVLTGLDIEAKAALIRAQVEGAMPVQPAELTWTLARTDHCDPSTQASAAATLTLVARDPDEKLVGRAVSGAAVEMALASYPGCFLIAPPSGGSPYGVFRPCFVDQGAVRHSVLLQDGSRIPITAPPDALALEATVDDSSLLEIDFGPTRPAAIGSIIGARSGDKGGNANIGVWARRDDEFLWLDTFLSIERLKHLLPELEPFQITRTRLPNLRSLNFVVEGLLGEGVAYGARFDPQAKALGEWLRARVVDLPERFLPELPKERP